MGGAHSVPDLGANSTAKDVIDFYQPDLKDKVAVVTGGSSGLGLQTCKALASAGAKVIMCTRNLEKGKKAIEEEVKVNGVSGYAVSDPNIEVMELELQDLHSIQRFAERIIRLESRIDLLVLNAAILACPKSVTKQGFELVMGTNYFGHFYLTNLLLPKLASQEGNSRIVVVASRACEWATLHIGDLHCRQRNYSYWNAYSESKLANILFAEALAERLKGSRVCVLSLHPGIVKSGLQGRLNQFLNDMCENKTIPQGAATILYACIAPELDTQSGAFLDNCAVSKMPSTGEDPDGTYQEALWRTTEAQIRQVFPRASAVFAAANAALEAFREADPERKASKSADDDRKKLKQSARDDRMVNQGS